MDALESEIYLRYKSLIEAEGITVPSDLNREPRRVHLADILDSYDAFCFDGYGTLYNRGNFLYPGAAEWYVELRKAGKFLRLVTNAASNTVDVLAKEAADRGFNFSAEETISSGSLLKNFVDDFRGKSGASGLGNSTKAAVRELCQVFYIGRETGKNVLQECNIEAVENPQEPIVAVSSSTATPEMYRHAVEILKKPGALLLVLNSDAWAPKIDGSREPVSGALSERLRRESDCDVRYFGKPFPAIWQQVRESLPAGSRVLMIGDTLGTDVYGAYVAGFDSALIVGRNVPVADLASDEMALGIRPTYYLEP